MLFNSVSAGENRLTRENLQETLENMREFTM